MKVLLSALVGLFGVTSLASGQYYNGGCTYEKYWTGYGWAYRQACAPAQVYYPQQAVVQPAAVEKKVESKTTVVNNLIGIPVPVQYNQPIAAQGTTVYGYSTAAEAYGSVDMGLLYNQAARLTDQAQQLAGQAAADFQTLVQAEGQNRAEVAKILAQGQAAHQALMAVKGQPITQAQTFRSFTFKVTQDAHGELKVEKTPDTGTPAQSSQPDFNLAGGKNLNISDILTNRCVSCHGNDKTQGGLNFMQSITDAQQKLVLERITETDPEKRMPPPAKGKLTVDEINAFFQAMGAKK